MMKQIKIIQYTMYFVLLTIVLYIITKYITKRKAMVIVEPRKHKLLKQVIDNFNTHMDSSWDLYVFHGKSHKEFATLSTKTITKRNVYLFPLDTDNLNADQYNYLLKQASFWNKVNAEHILVFQTDTVVCGKSIYNINSFLKYPYVGCPFDNTTVDNHPIWGDYPFYGIGGLSIRKKSFMMDCIRRNPNVENNYAEDIFFSKCVKDSNIKSITIDVLNQFCTQHTYTKNSFGAHKVNVDLQKEEKQSFYSFCPEAKILESTSTSS